MGLCFSLLKPYQDYNKDTEKRLTHKDKEHGGGDNSKQECQKFWKPESR